MQSLGFIDCGIVFGFLAICLVVGLYSVSKIKTIEEFAIGYKNTSLTVLVCAIFASSIGAGSTIGVTGKVYEFGAVFIIQQLFIPLVWLFNSAVVGSNIMHFQGCISLTDIMYQLYGRPGRIITVFAAIVKSLGSIAAQAIAMGWIFHYFLGIDTTSGVLIGYGVITIYAALGGIKAVIPTEIFKSAIILFIVPISFVTAFSINAGITSVLEHLPESHLHISEEDLNLLASFALIYLLPSFSPALIQRCLMARSAEQLKSKVFIKATFCSSF